MGEGAEGQGPLEVNVNKIINQYLDEARLRVLQEQLEKQGVSFDPNKLRSQAQNLIEVVAKKYGYDSFSSVPSVERTKVLDEMYQIISEGSTGEKTDLRRTTEAIISRLGGENRPIDA